METVVTKSSITIGLMGQPNTGKSTIFNSLTGARQHVGNWAGKTVEQKQGKFQHNGITYNIVDLPGTYSLSANSEEELITRDYIFSNKSDTIVALIDASQLERSMYLLADFAGIDVPIVVVLTMIDVAERNGKRIDYKKLEQRLGVPVIPIVATQKKSIPHFLNRLEASVIDPKTMRTDNMVKKYQERFGADFDRIMQLLPESGIGNYSREWITIKLFESDENIKNLIKEQIEQKYWAEIAAITGVYTDGVIIGANCKYEWISAILSDTVKADSNQRRKRSRFDKIATHPIWGKPLAFILILLGFVASLLVALVIKAGAADISLLTLQAEAGLLAMGTAPILVSLIVEALIPGFLMVLYVIAFVLGVSFVFGLMEDIGYMARVAYVFDSLMSKLGLHGKSVMPFLMCFGCTIGGVSGTRVIDSSRQRLITIATSWAIPCAGTWGVVGLMSGLFFGVNAVWVILALFATTILHMKVTSWFFRRSLLKNEGDTGLIMELPPYHKPNWKTIFSYVWARVKGVATKAFSIIMLVSVVIWLLSYSSGGNIENSALYAIGKFLEPIGSVFGLNWQLLVAFLVSAMGKEGALGAIAILYGAGGGVTSFAGTLIPDAVTINQSGMETALLSSISAPQALAFLFAFFFNAPCMAAVASTALESHSYKWTLKVTAYYLATALILAGIVYRIALLVF
jgi:ferrous iron transport protein B